MLFGPLYFFPHVFKNQYIHPEALKTFQEKRLRHMVEHAYRNTQFYKEKFRKAGITPHDINGLEDLRKIPLTSKEEIRASPEKLIASGYNETNCEVHYTSGTSGMTLKVLYDMRGDEHETAISYRYHLGQGLRPWRKYMLILHDPIELKDIRRKTLFYRKMGISGDLSLEEKVKAAQSYQPYAVGGHLSTFAAIAKYAETKGIQEIKPKIIIVGGELSLPTLRRYVEKVFEGETFDKYGAFEVKSIAWECKHHGMHIDADSVIVEFLKDGEPVAPGERGEVVVTNVWNKAMPFIRYRLGDIGIPSDETCECGRTLPLMKVIEGRVDDFIVLPSGIILPPTALVPHFFRTPQVKQFKILQNTKDTLTVKVVPDKTYTDDVEKQLLEKVKTALGEPVDITIERVDTIEQNQNTKYRAVVSKVDIGLSAV